MYVPRFRSAVQHRVVVSARSCCGVVLIPNGGAATQRQEDES